MLHNNRRKNGFSIIEMLIVLGIIAVIIAIAARGLIYGIQFSKDQTNERYLVELSQMVNQYYSDNDNTVPTSTCPNTTQPGFDQTNTIMDTSGLLSQLWNDSTVQRQYGSEIIKIENIPDLGWRMGYCSDPNQTSYFLILETSTLQQCSDTNGNYYYAIGRNSYLNNSSTNVREYFNLASDLGISALSNMNEGCFKQL